MKNCNISSIPTYTRKGRVRALQISSVGEPYIVERKGTGDISEEVMISFFANSELKISYPLSQRTPKVNGYIIFDNPDIEFLYMPCNEFESIYTLCLVQDSQVKRDLCAS